MFRLLSIFALVLFVFVACGGSSSGDSSGDDLSGGDTKISSIPTDGNIKIPNNLKK